VQTSNGDLVRGQLERAVAGFGLAAEAVRWDRLEQLLSMWERFGRAFNLSGATDRAGLLEHVLEGLQVVALARQVGWTPEQRWVDVGSGAGFPGLVVAACLEMTVTLVEPRERRAAFLDLAVHEIGRADCRVLRGHVEGQRWRPIRQGDRLENGFDWASARAVWDPVTWIKVARGWVRPGGVVVVHVRPEVEIEGVVARVDGERWSVRGVQV
jgi:16S rRNA (guanine527-N7)-methyltransferase